MTVNFWKCELLKVHQTPMPQGGKRATRRRLAWPGALPVKGGARAPSSLDGSRRDSGPKGPATGGSGTQCRKRAVGSATGRGRRSEWDRLGKALEAFGRLWLPRLCLILEMQPEACPLRLAAITD